MRPHSRMHVIVGARVSGAGQLGAEVTGREGGSDGGTSVIQLVCVRVRVCLFCVCAIVRAI